MKNNSIIKRKPSKAPYHKSKVIYPTPDKRFSIKEFFRIAEPETVHWNKFSEEDAECLSAFNRENEDCDEQLKSLVRGMTNTIKLQVLIDELERLVDAGL